MEKQKWVRVKVYGYDHKLVDTAIDDVVRAAKSVGALIRGPIPLPSQRERLTVLKSPHKYKDARDQFEIRTHKRILDIDVRQDSTMRTLRDLQLSAGVGFGIELLGRE